MALGAESPVALASRGKATKLAVLVDGVNNPVDAGILLNPNNHIHLSAQNMLQATSKCKKLTLRIALWAGSTRMTS